MPLQIGRHAQTPFRPSGLVDVVAIEDLHPLLPRQTVLVRFLDRHPHGYPPGTLGRYFYDELRPVDPDAAGRPPLSSPPPPPPRAGSSGIPGIP